MVTLAIQARLDAAEIRRWLDRVPDPEIPVLSVNDLGVVRGISVRPDGIEIAVTPTYSGCPATAVIERDIAKALRDHGLAGFRIRRQLSPPWTTDWISAEGKRKLAEYGIVPPEPGAAGATVKCPHCGSMQTEKLSQFGSTPCKAAWRCEACLEPFEVFKCI